MNIMNTPSAKAGQRIARMLGSHYDYLNIICDKEKALVAASLGSEWASVEIYRRDNGPFSCYLRTYRREEGETTEVRHLLNAGNVAQLEEAVRELIEGRKAA